MVRHPVWWLALSLDHLVRAQQQRLRDREAKRLRRFEIQRQIEPGGLHDGETWMGSTHFLTKRLPRVSTEMSLHVLAYNLKRVMQILGIGPLMQAMRA